MRARHPHRKRCGLLIGAAAMLLMSAAWAAQDDASSESMAVTTKDKLRFVLPPDWPVEKRGGIVAPIPIEEYLAKKFSALEARLRVMEQQLAGIELRVRTTEEAVKASTNSLRSSESSGARVP